MNRPRPPYLQRERSRHGRMVWYVRVNRQSPRIRIYADYGTPEFMAEYQAAIEGKPRPNQAHKIRHGSLEWLVNQWKASSDWHLTKPATKKQRENILDRVTASAGQTPAGDITAEDILAGRERRMTTPAAANNFLKTMRALFKWACGAGHLKSNPAASVKLLPHKGEGFTPWTEADLEAYRNRWPLGTRQRLAMELMLWTGLRRGDAVRLGRQHIRAGVATLRAEKTGVELSLSILPALQEAIDAGPIGDLAFISGTHGEPLTKESFGNYFRDWCNAAGVKASAHGLRKLSATMAANAGATEKELQALYGWKTTSQSQVYTRRANNAALAKSAGEKLSGESYSRTEGKVRESAEKTVQLQEVKNANRKDGGRY
jgi:integrase